MLHVEISLWRTNEIECCLKSCDFLSLFLPFLREDTDQLRRQKTWMWKHWKRFYWINYQKGMKSPPVISLSAAWCPPCKKPWSNPKIWIWMVKEKKQMIPIFPGLWMVLEAKSKRCVKQTQNKEDGGRRRECGRDWKEVSCSIWPNQGGGQWGDDDNYREVEWLQRRTSKIIPYLTHWPISNLDTYPLVWLPRGWRWELRS